MTAKNKAKKKEAKITGHPNIFVVCNGNRPQFLVPSQEAGDRWLGRGDDDPDNVVEYAPVRRRSTKKGKHVS